MFARDRMVYSAMPLPERAELDDEAVLAGARAFQERMRTRRSVRDFADRPVAREVIESCIRTAGGAPSGANHQPWHYVAISDPATKRRIREAAEEEERRFYDGAGGDEWLKALEPIGTDASKPHLEVAPWLIAVFAQRWGRFDDGTRYKNYYVPESVGISCGFLIAAIHHAGLGALTHTPNPMRFLTELCGRPASEKPLMIVAVGHPAPDATIPAAARMKKGLSEIATFVEPPAE